ncbi:galactonate dehydratase [Pseudonocardia sp. MH-G8]|uniref:galactonate dehydratase n=1 Tax=Pseudonocardia sp. MH-G8 TaxID=1854588 RepID=UPI000BA0C1BD|nr:galactonate dehydratase [Pseudonocardia sp. MH-G8]OZM79889.1 galactonate dehydratase [Pseudonocardia sp. MH-G8]
MKIVGYELFLVEPRWLFLRLDTDEGVSGWGEPIVEGRAATTARGVEEAMEYLVGQDASRIEDHWQVLTKGGFYRGGPVLGSVTAGIDQALWDIAGRALGVPVHQLLGGPVRDRARVYGWVHGSEPAELAEAARAQVERGLTAVKMNPSELLAPLDTPAAIQRVVDRVAAVRDAVGSQVDVAIDCHGRFSTAMSRRVLPLLEPLQPLFVEEPVLPEHTRDLDAVVRSTTIPVATGERLFSRWDFRAAFEAGIAVAQPDVSHAGGISETRRIAAMAEVHDVLLAPHCPLGPIALAASLQVDFATPNFLIQEQSLGIGYGDDTGLLGYLVDSAPFTFVDGSIERPTGPGLGIEVDEAAVRRAAERGHDWRTPLWRHADGSLAAW